jgi:hypothetical protein
MKAQAKFTTVTGGADSTGVFIFESEIMGFVINLIIGVPYDRTSSIV